MKRIALALSAIVIMAFPIFSQDVSIPDANFLAALIDEGVDTNGDSLISYEEAESVCFLDVVDRGISDMTGIEAFSNLDSLWCQTNTFTKLDMSGNPALRFLNCGGYSLLIRSVNELNVLNNPVLETLNCQNTDITELDLSKNSILKHLDCSYNDLSTLDISQNINLTYINLSGMNILKHVCIWTMPFPPPGVYIDTESSPNVEFTDCSTGIYDYSLSGLTIYPNPCGSHLTIETENPNHYSININTLNGQQILSGEMERTSHQLDLSSFQKGVYFITIRSEDFITTRKVIKL